MGRTRYSIDVTLTMTPTGSRLDDVASVCCPGCNLTLNLHQPDSEEPGRLLGVCGRCRGWYLLAADEGWMVILPPREDLFRPSSGSDGTPGA